MKTNKKLTGTALIEINLQFTRTEMIGEDCPHALLASILEDLPVTATLGDGIGLQVTVKRPAMAEMAEA